VLDRFFSYARSVGRFGKRLSWLSRGPLHYFPPRGRLVVNLDELLDLWKQEPLTRRAITKKSKDLFEAGFRVTGLSEEEKMVEEELNEFLNNSRIRLKWKLSRAARDAMVFGNGFLEIIYLNDKNPRADEPPDAEDIYDFVSIDPRRLIIVEDLDANSDNYGKIHGYLSIPPVSYISGTNQPLIISKDMVGTWGFEGKLIHPDRIVHLKFDTLSDSNLGLSTIEPAYHILKSKIQADKVFGTIMTRYAKPILDVTIENGDAEQIRSAGIIASKVNERADEVAHLVHDQMWKTNVLGSEGKAINPKLYMSYLVEQLAITLQIPKVLLVGSEAGTISGSDLNLISYYQTLESEQETVITPLLLSILDRLWLVRHKQHLPAHIGIKHNKLYSDEIGAVKAQFMDIQSMVAVYSAGLLPRDETRRKVAETYGMEYTDDEDQYVVIKDKPGDVPEEVPSARPAGDVKKKEEIPSTEEG
jgi:hypothetical protein